MRIYLDTSALVKLYVDEEGSPLVREHVDQALLVATSMISYVEARAAFARRRYEGMLSAPEHRRVVRALDVDWQHFVLLEVTDALIREAARFAEAHRLRAYDAIHLASAALVKNKLAETVLFLSWDANLESAARREGLESLPGRRR